MAEDNKNLPAKQELLIPTLAQLVEDTTIAWKNDQFKVYLNQEPPEKWVKKNSMAKNARYLPIDKVELLLDVIFEDWYPEVLNVTTMLNSVAVTVRLHVQNPITHRWKQADGVGAWEIQHDADTKLSMDTIKDAGVKMALPIAKSVAIKDAADHLGVIFGRNLGRKDTLAFSSPYANARKPVPMDKSDERLITMILSSTSLQQLQKFEKDIPEDKPEVQNAYNIKFAELDK